MLLSLQSSGRFRSMLEQRRKLPAWNEKENILDVLDRCQVLVISGMTGWVTQCSVKCWYSQRLKLAKCYLYICDLVIDDGVWKI